MEDFDVIQALQKYTAPVIQRLLSDELSSTFPDCARLLEYRVIEIPAWQIALPVICSQAVGGSVEVGNTVAAAWYPMSLASEILDSVEDKEFIPDHIMPSPETAANLATSLIFLAFHNLTMIQDPDGARRVSRIYSRLGFEATNGQHRDLTAISATVEQQLNDYWETTILKSGSVFRTATAGGAASGTSDEALIEELGDYGTALGVMLQLLDDCRDAFSQLHEAIHWEISLPLLLYLMTIGEEKIAFPKINTKAEWSNVLRETGVITAISELLLEWKMRALESLALLSMSKEKLILEKIPSFFLERIPVFDKEARDGSTSREELS